MWVKEYSAVERGGGAGTSYHNPNKLSHSHANMGSRNRMESRMISIPLSCVLLHSQNAGWLMAFSSILLVMSLRKGLVRCVA